MKRMRLQITLLLLISILCFNLAGAYAENDEKITLTIARPVDVNIIDLETNAITLMLEEKFNVDLQFIEYPSADAEAKFAVLASSGGEMPDIVNILLPNTSAYSYGSKGIFIPLNEYWNDPEMTPNFDEICDDPELKDYILSCATMPDGNIYTLPTYSEYTWNQMPYRYWINVQWLENLGIDMPKTTEEFLEVLEAFATQDPNQNGIDDEIPLIGSRAWCADPTVFLLNSFIFTSPDQSYFYVDNGEVKPAFTQDAFKEGLEYVRSIMEAGYLYPASFTQDQTQFKAIINQDGDNIVGVVAAGSASNWIDYQGSARFAEYELLEPLTGPEGTCYSAYAAPSIFGRVYITSSCKHPELAFSLLEYCYNLHFTVSDRYGVYGVNWSDDPDIIAQYVGEYEAVGVKTLFAVMDDVWGVQQNVHWDASLPIFENNAISCGWAGTPRTDDYDETKLGMKAQHYLRYLSHAPEEYLPSLVFTEEETNELALVKTAVDTYVQENIVSFVTGNRSLDEWDSFVDELNKMGLDTYTAILQAAYDR